MSSDVRLRRALPRLLVSLAVLLCLLGLGESMPDGRVGDSHDGATVATSAHMTHDATPATGPPAVSTEVGSSGHTTHGDAGHGEHGFHGASCMVAVMVAALPLLVSTGSDVVLGSWSPATSNHRLERGPTVGVGADPPDLSALCVQRV